MNQFGKDYEAIRRLIDENKYLKEDGNDTLEGIYNQNSPSCNMESALTGA